MSAIGAQRTWLSQLRSDVDDPPPVLPRLNDALPASFRVHADVRYSQSLTGGEHTMKNDRTSCSALAVALAVPLLMAIGGAEAQDDRKYPHLKGQWTRFIVPGLGGQPSFDQTKSWGKGQQAPLTPEYQALSLIHI